MSMSRISELFTELTDTELIENHLQPMKVFA